MEKHEYTIWVSYGLTISSDENFDENTEEGFVKIQNLAKEKLSQIGITEIIADAEFGDIMHDIIEDEDISCNCKELDDDLIEDGSTCYNCYAYRKDNNTKENN